MLPEDPGKTSDGYPSNLTEKQEEALRQIWRKLDAIIHQEKASPSEQPQNGSGGAALTADGEQQGEVETGKSALSGFSKDDKEKNAMRLAKEKEETAKALKSVNRVQFRDIIWYGAQHHLAQVMADNPDSLILRFLRARHFDVESSFAMLCSSVAWRFQLNVPQLLAVGEIGLGGFKEGLGGHKQDPKEGERFLKQYSDGKAFTYGTDKAGRPVTVINVSKHIIGAQSVLALQRFVVLAVESARMALVSPAEEGTAIFDLTGFGVRNMDFFAIKYMLDIFGSYYPQVISQIIVHNAPFYFYPFWYFIKPLVYEEIRDKVVFASTQELTNYIPREHLPVDLGGTADWKWSYVPPAEENEVVKAVDDQQRVEFFDEIDKLNLEYEQATREWCDACDAGDKSASEAARIKRDEVQLKRYVLCRKGDPYWRASTFLTRSGAVPQYGRAKWTYPRKEGTTDVEEWGLSDEEVLQKASKGPAGGVERAED